MSGADAEPLISSRTLGAVGAYVTASVIVDVDSLTA